jgi:hypothetical protein
VYKVLSLFFLLKIGVATQPHNITKKIICGKYKEAGSPNNVYLTFKRNHTFCMIESNSFECLYKIDGRWQIKDDTLYIRSKDGEWVSGLTRTDDKLYICRTGNTTEPVCFVKSKTKQKK